MAEQMGVMSVIKNIAKDAHRVINESSLERQVSGPIGGESGDLAL